MGMPCEINNILKLNVEQGFPGYKPEISGTFHAIKEGYRIFPVGVPILLVDSQWTADSQVKIAQLTWKEDKTHLKCEVVSHLGKVISVK